MKLSRLLLLRPVRTTQAFLGLSILAFGARGAAPLPDLDVRLKGAWPPYGRATARAVVANNDHAYLAAGEAGLLVFDVSEPSQPRHVGTLAMPGFASGLAISGEHVFMANRGVGEGTNQFFSGLHVINVRNPAHPRAVATVATSGRAVDVAVSGTRVAVLYGGDQSDAGPFGTGVEVFDVRNPQQPKRMGRIEAVGSVRALAASDGIACYIESQNQTHRLSVIDLSAADGPRRVGQQWISDSYVAVALANRHAFLSSDSSMQVVDLTDPARPKFIAGNSWVEGASANGLLIAGQYAFTGSTVVDISNLRELTEIGMIVEGSSKGLNSAATMALAGDSLVRIGRVLGDFGIPKIDTLHVIDVSDPLHPLTVGTHVVEARAWDVSLSGSLAYVANGLGGLQIVDVSNPQTPVRLADHLVVGEVWRVAVAGTNVCLLGRGGMTVVDVSDLRNPRSRGVYQPVGSASDLTAAGDRVFVFAEGPTRSLEVVDLSDPDRLRQVLRLDIETFPDWVPVSAHFRYTPDAAEGWLIHDVSDPGNPVRVGSYRAIVEALGGILVGNQVHTSDGHVFDVTDPARPERVGSTYPTIRARSGDVGGAWDQEYGWQFYDLSDPAVPRLIGRYPGGSFVIGGRPSWGVELRGTDAFLAAGTAGLQIVDLFRPSNLVRTPESAISELNAAHGLTPTSSGAYLAYSGKNLQVFDLTDPTRPRRLGGFSVQSQVADVLVSGHSAFVAEWGVPTQNQEPSDGRLSIIDLSDPSGPRETGALALGGTAWAVVVSGTMAFVSAGSQGLLAVDVSDPTHPVEADRLDTGGFAIDVALVGSYALVADSVTGLQVVDISQPSQLRWVAEYRGDNGAQRIEISGDRAYVWGVQGMLVFDITNPARPRPMNHVALTRNDPGIGLASASIVGDYVFVVNNFGLEVFDLKDPLQPRRIARNSAVYPWSWLLLSGSTILLHESDGDAGGVRMITVPPFFRSLSQADGQLQLEWEGWGRARLQWATAADSSDWQDVPGTESLKSVVLPQKEPNGFFRLYQP